MMRTRDNDISKFYRNAVETVIKAGYGDEINWQRKIMGKEITEQYFLAEGAWVILNSGFKEIYIRKIWDAFSLCFWNWENTERIVKNKNQCRNTSLSVFGNKRKINAIIEMAEVVTEQGFSATLEAIHADPIEELQSFSMIGPITSQHLAKNLGLPFAKADRHLERIREEFGFADVQSMCEHLGAIHKESVPVIDIVLWRYSTLGGN